MLTRDSAVPVNGSLSIPHVRAAFVERTRRAEPKSTTSVRKPPTNDSTRSCTRCDRTACKRCCNCGAIPTSSSSVTSEATRARERFRTPGPHVVEHFAQAPQSDQAHDFGLWHSRSQPAVSKEAPTSHGSPPCWACCLMLRYRCFWPLHFVHDPQAFQSPHWHEIGFKLSSVHAGFEHGATSLREPEHPLPLPWDAVKTLRMRICWPVPQLLLHELHEFQSVSTQSTVGGSTMHPFACTLQGSTWFIGPMQNFPLPRPCTAKFRVRSLQPSHAQLQSLHAAHSENLQSMLTLVHVTPTLHGLYSCVRPVTALPHSLGSTATCLERQVAPPRHVAVHFSHSVQADHLPSTQGSQRCVLQACICRLSPGTHNLPRPLGDVAMWRERIIEPPPHVHEQPLQSAHSPQAQSTFSAQGFK
mmetsp:Transcript_90512/g.255509  ORF Transcript_90512/g.255509 Transcript_90512/m.255509 type:complete len:415 (-) Transcript_90512:700-1944(-)